MDVITGQRVSPSCTSSSHPTLPPVGHYSCARWDLLGTDWPFWPEWLMHLLVQGRNAVVTAHCSDQSRYWTNQHGVYKVVKGVYGKPVRCTAALATSIAVLYIYILYIYIYSKHRLPFLSRRLANTGSLSFHCVYKVVKGVHRKLVRCTAALATSIAVLYIYIYI